ncbi:NAD(P)/FAD-dependent oxidoreductase [Leifsonia sp. AG29]|uniref:NAD(P)/FAD-dependent oxidoreductase n=1 Tax=Leifsonia sp. AG29 TaxID=2598860 RepID=UPI00131EB2F7|nr:FAD-dependent oxidoreductase [Leifsonia sp. AG29]
MSGGLVIVGASLAGLRAAQAARRERFEGDIALIGDEAHLPYDRPPLSKAYLAADGQPDFYATAEELRDLGITLRLSTRVDRLDAEAREVVLSTGERVPFDTLIVATGATPRRLPGVPKLPGVVTLRTLDDALELREMLHDGVDVVIIGAGFIGSEIASSAHEKGATVTILEAAPVPLVRAVGEVVGAALSSLHDRNGVRLVRSARITEIAGVDRVREVVLADGERIPADLVVVGIGAAPATGWLASSGIELNPDDGGVVCDEYLESSIPGVYAAGDVAHWPNRLMDTTMRLENWTSAADQGARAGINAVAPEKRAAFETVPYFWSDWYGSRIQFVGSAVAESVNFASGDPERDRFIALYRTGDRLVGAAALNEQRKVMKLRRVIQLRGTVEDALSLIEETRHAHAVGASS